MVFEIEFEWYFSDSHVGHAEQLAGFTVCLLYTSDAADEL